MFVDDSLVSAGSIGFLQLGNVPMFAESDHCGESEVQKYFADLAADEARVAELRTALEKASVQQLVIPGMARAFDENMQIFNEDWGADEWPGWAAIRESRWPHMRDFLEQVHWLENGE